MSWRRKASTDDVGIINSLPNDAETANSSSYGSGSSSVETSIIITKPDGWGARHTLAFVGFLGFMASYAMRVNLSIAIVAMVKNVNTSAVTVNVTVCPALLKSNSEISSIPGAEAEFYEHESPGEFEWNGAEQGVILGAFFWGYVVLQVPGGMLAERIGGKWPFGIGMLLTAVLSILIPTAARAGKGYLIGCRVFQGLGEGITNPSMHALLARWLPPLERSKFGAFIYIGANAGVIVTMPICGYLILAFGWPSVFYVAGITTCIWFIFWSFFVFNSPKEHPRIELSELNYIEQSIGLQMSKVGRVPTPWKKMLTSMPVFSILVVQTGHAWGLYTLLTELPTYLKTILHFDMKSNGYFSALPYTLNIFVGLSSSWYADYLREHYYSTTIVRKLFLTIAHFGSAIFLIALAFIGCDRVLAVTLITLSIGLNGAANAAFQINHIDIASNHAGVMMGVTNGFANLMGILAPYVAGVIINDISSLNKWRLIFLIAAGIYIIDNIFYVIFASGEEQSWNRSPSDNPKTTPRSARRARSDRQPLLLEGGTSD